MQMTHNRFFFMRNLPPALLGPPALLLGPPPALLLGPPPLLLLGPPPLPPSPPVPLPSAPALLLLSAGAGADGRGAGKLRGVLQVVLAAGAGAAADGAGGGGLGPGRGALNSPGEASSKQAGGLSRAAAEYKSSSRFGRHRALPSHSSSVSSTLRSPSSSLTISV